MSNLNYTSFVKWHKVYYRLMYWIILIIGAVVCFVKNSGVDKKGYLLSFFFSAGFCYLVTEMLTALNYFESSRVHTVFKFFEILCYSLFLSQLSEQTAFSVAGYILIFVLGVEYITYESDFDRTTVLVRKIGFVFVMMTNAGVVIGTGKENLWIIYLCADLLLCVCVLFIVDWFAGQNYYFDKKKDELYIKIGELDDANMKLTEYRDRMKNVNEQINFQKIDLSRANREMEETNRDIVAQTEVLQYIVSSFDIPKCIEVMAHSIVEVRKAKLCAIYLSGSKISDMQSLVVIKSDIAIVERRLKKDISKLYTDFISQHKEPVIYSGAEELAAFHFIGESNIRSMAIIPILDKTKNYGFMIVASNDDRYFVHGTNKFDADIIGIRLALKNKAMYLNMQNMARHDGLTGIYNRVYFTELFNASCKKSKNKETPISIALFDIDHFKHVNDTYGHLAGDEVLINVAKATDALAKKYNGYCCRFGGEEFLVVLPGYESDEALKVFEELHENIKALRVNYNNTIISVDVCIGMTTYPTICDNTNNMISRADKAMYYGKNHGRGRLIVDSDHYDD